MYSTKKLFVGILCIFIIIVVGFSLKQKAEEGNVPVPGEIPENTDKTEETPFSEPDSDPIAQGGTKLPVFPGAVGYGTETQAGRGGKVIEVTTLDDSPGDGPVGSLRRAILTPGPRIIVFKVGGIIKLKEALYIRDPFITIAGHTAPGDGITLRDFGIEILTHDILVQHIRVRPGNEGNVAGNANDGINFLGTRYGGDIYNVVLDHVSVSWAEDENVSMLGGLKDITISNSIVSEGLNRSRHGKGTHSTGLYVGDTSTFSVIGNILAHNNFRNPVIINNYDFVSMTGEVLNNVIYDWQDLATESANYAHQDGGFVHFNLVGNTYRNGPSTKNHWPVMMGREGFPKIYARDNSAPDFLALLTPEMIEENNLATDDYMIIGGNEVKVDKDVAETHIKASVFNTPGIQKVQRAELAYEEALNDAGATKPKRDHIDTRIVNDIRNRTGSIIDSPSDVGGYGLMQSGTAPQDSDHDGMSDAWETAQGLNPQDTDDGNEDQDGDGYTNVEEYLFSLL